MTNLTEMTLAQARENLRKRAFSALELTEAHLAAIGQANPTLNIYIALNEEGARQAASKSDALLAKQAGRPLEGLPLAAKDLFATKNLHTQACSKILQGFIPAYESTVTQNLWQNGAILLGKTNMDEFAMGSSNETSCYGLAVNPWRAEGKTDLLVPGGSSGGSAASVAANLCLGATATDTGGSIRQPASFTGTVGLKPSYGRCSRWGIIAFASSLDQAGPIAKNVQDSAILLKYMASYDPQDATSADIPVPDYEAEIGASIKGMKIGIPREYRVEGMDEEIDKLWAKGMDWLRDAGAEIIDISLAHTRFALPVYYIIAPAEASSNLARYDGVRYGLRESEDCITEMLESTRALGFGPEVKKRIMIGTYVLSAGYYDEYYGKAQKVRRLVKQDFDEAFNSGIDAVLTPTSPNAAFAAGAITDPITMYLNDIFTVTVNLAGLPAISIPGALSREGLPLGLQLIAPKFCEEKLIRIGAVIERQAGHFRPDIWWQE